MYWEKTWNLYKVLLEIEVGDNSWQRWEKEVQGEIDVHRWQATNKYILSVSANVAIRECFYKIRHQWYLTQSCINKMFPVTDLNCWRFKQGVGDFIHIWWSCPKLMNSWEMIHGEISQILKVPMEFTPWCFLLHI